MYGVCYQLKTKPQQSTPIVQSVMEETIQEEAPFMYVGAFKDDELDGSIVESHDEQLSEAEKVEREDVSNKVLYSIKKNIYI